MFHGIHIKSYTSWCQIFFPMYIIILDDILCRIVFFFFNLLIIYLLVLNLCGCMSSSLVVSGGYSLVVSRVLTAVASLVEEHWRQSTLAAAVATYGFSSCGSQVLEHRLNSCDPQFSCSVARGKFLDQSFALVGGFFTTEPPGKPSNCFHDFIF